MLKASEQAGTSALLDAMSNDKVHLVRFVLDALDGEILDSKAEGAQTPLICSVLLPNSQTRCRFIELLLQKGANVNHQDGNGRSALSHACENGYLDAVKILVQNGADPEIQDSWGNTPLMYAAVAGHTSVVEFLVRAFKRLGLQIDRQNKAGNSAVEVAKFLGHTACISALTNSKRSHETDEGKFERKVDSLAGGLEVLEICDSGEMSQIRTLRSTPQMKPKRLPAMEFERENTKSSSGLQDIISGLRAPGSWPGIYTQPISKRRNNLEGIPSSSHHLPPLLNNRSAEKSMFFSPQPKRNIPHPCAPSTLGILLTPLLPSRCDNEMGREKTFRMRKLNECYYRKRCSLPASMLSPTPPERFLAPVRKSRTARKRNESISLTEPLQFNMTASASTATTFSALTNKFFRRFTSPEFKKDEGGLEEKSVSTLGRIPRSETFPQDPKHPLVDSTPSIDSISSVKCEFDCQFKRTNS